MKILLADDHDLFRDGLSCILVKLDTDNLCLLESQDYKSTVSQMLVHDDLDLVLLDLNMPGMHGMQSLRELIRQFPTQPIVVLTASSRSSDIETSLQLGAAGFIPKASPTEVLLSALKLILKGGIYAPRLNEQANTQIAATSGPAMDLTKRQREILSCIAEGMPNKAIARHLFLSESTIKGHVRAVLQILNVKNRVQAINKAREIGELG